MCPPSIHSTSHLLNEIQSFRIVSTKETFVKTSKKGDVSDVASFNQSKCRNGTCVNLVFTWRLFNENETYLGELSGKVENTWCEGSFGHSNDALFLPPNT